MPAAMPAAHPIREVIDLVTDSEDDDDLPNGLAAAAIIRDFENERPNSPRQREPPLPDMDGIDDFFHFNDMGLPNAFLQPDAAAPAQEPNPFDQDYDFGFLAADEAVPQQRAGATQEERDFAFALAVDGGQVFTIGDCLQRVLELFPDVSHEYVSTLYAEFDVQEDYESLPGPARLDNIIEKLLSNSSYPKQSREKSAQLKRKREESDGSNDMQQWLRDDRDAVPGFLVGSMRSMLKSEFPHFPNPEITRILTEKKHYFQAHVHLAYLSDTGNTVRRGRPSTRFADADTIALNSGWPDLSKELEDARVQVAMDRKARAEEAAKRKAEQDNLRKAIDAGETAECQACFDNLPMNRQIHCNGETAHFTCFECAETYIKSEVGESSCRVMCTAGCGAAFDPHQLNLLSDKKLLAKLAQLEQEKAIRDAGLDDLEECPFCDYKAIVPPIDEDFEFRCASPECERVSCRRCRATTHIPLSCEQHAKDNHINSRHKIEEAMTAALVRNCNGCKKQFIKEYGCNKMTCPSCRHLQCYICSKTLKDYNHFDQNPNGRRVGGAASAKCPLYDNVEERHEREVKAAEEAARAEVVAENPDVSVEDLEIKVSDAVKKSTAQRIRQAGPRGLGMGDLAGHMEGFGAAIAGAEHALPQVDALRLDMRQRQAAQLMQMHRARARAGFDNGAGRNVGGLDFEELGEEVAEQLHRVRMQRRQNAGANEPVGQVGERHRRTRLEVADPRAQLLAGLPAPAPNQPANIQPYVPVFGWADAGVADQNPNPYAMAWEAPNQDANRIANHFEEIQNILDLAAAPAQLYQNQGPPVTRPAQEIRPQMPGAPQPHPQAPHNRNGVNNAANQANLNPYNFAPVPGALHNGLWNYQPLGAAPNHPDPAPTVAPHMLGNGNSNIPVRQVRQGFEHLELMRQANDAQNGLALGWNDPFWNEGMRNGRHRPQPRR